MSIYDETIKLPRIFVAALFILVLGIGLLTSQLIVFVVGLVCTIIGAVITILILRVWYIEKIK